MNDAAGARTVDLQVHSTASDGAVAPGDIPRIAAAAGLSAFALTDHDSLAGVEAARVTAAALGVRVVPGVELSVTHDDGREVHLLGLHVRTGGALESRLAQFRVERAERAVHIVARLRELGVTITIEDVAREAGGGAMGRPHVARALVASGAVANFRMAFSQFIGAGRPAYIPKPRLATRDAVSLVHDAGGLAIWAHPAADGRRELMESLANDGLDGVEVLHPSHSADDRARIAALASHFALLPSGGSDWHGENDGGRKLGSQQVPAEWLERQDAKVALRARGGGS